MQMVCQMALALALSAAPSATAQQSQPGVVGEVGGRPKIQSTEFGSITIDGRAYQRDVIIRLNGKVEKRKKALSKEVYSTSHIISLEEAKQVYEEGAERLIVGSGQSGMVKLSDEAVQYFKRKGCKVELMPTPVAIRAWNEAKGAVIGLFHITC